MVKLEIINKKNIYGCIQLAEIEPQIIAKRCPQDTITYSEVDTFSLQQRFEQSFVAGEGTRLGHGGIGVVVNKKCKLGRNCILAQNVTLASKDGGALELGDWVYVEANSVVLGGKSW